VIDAIGRDDLGEGLSVACREDLLPDPPRLALELVRVDSPSRII
jgi:hypothetical protein